MKKKLLSLTMALIMAVAVWVPTAAGEASAAVTVTPRTSLPSYTSDVGLKYYYTNDNVYYKFNYGPNLKYLSSRKGYVRGNCTWYAYARAGEILGHTFNPAFRYSAYRWYAINKAGGYYPYGSTPKVGAIACYSNHVAIVEKIVNGKVYVSESGWRIGAKPTTASQIYFHYGTPWYSKAVGYIYITEGSSASATTTAPTYTTTAANYQVKISATNLNMRTGPGTSYESKGYVKTGTYTINAESGGWGRLSSNGYWVSLSYTTKVTSATTTAATTTTTTTTKATATTAAATTTSYQIKVTASDLNMRTGPGTSYATKGHIKAGTYTVVEEKSGWGKLSTNGYWINLSYVTKVNAQTTSTTKATTAATTATTKATTTTAAATTGAKFNVKITGSGLAMRKGAGTSYKKMGTVTKGKVYAIKAVKNGWGQLSSNGYWIKLSYTTLSGSSNVKITAKDLNMRTGAGTKYKSKGYAKTGSYAIKAMKNGWVQLSSNGYWVNMSYVKFV